MRREGILTSRRSRGAGLTGAHLLAGLAVFILIGWGAGELWTHLIGSSEVNLMREISADRTHAESDLAKIVTWAGSSFVLVPLALIACGLLLRAGSRAQALTVALSLGGAMIISDAVKLLVARPRPPVEHLQAVTGFKLPVGSLDSGLCLLAVTGTGPQRGQPDLGSERGSWRERC